MAMNHRLGLEIPAFGALAASQASHLGATRIELNAQGSYSDGGLTPSLQDLETVDAPCPLRVMIRPRGPPSAHPPAEASGRDFLYTPQEFEIMNASIEAFRNSGLLDVSRGDGFVFGILEEDLSGEDMDRAPGSRCRVDKTRCTRLVQAARPFKCVFHRAFDEIVSCDDTSLGGRARPSWEEGLEDVAACGFNGILTSGGLGRAIDNVDMLENIIRKARIVGIEIIIGGGVRTANVGRIIERLGLYGMVGSVYLHSACLRGDGSEHIDHAEVQGIVAQLS